MSDGWEDWEDGENIPLNEEQLKILEERKLLQESDKALARDLCKNNKEYDLVCEDLEKMKLKNVIIEKPTKISNQKTNEDKMKELSEKNKSNIKTNNKKNNKGEKELFGEEEYYDEYEEYQDKFY
jgi:hypothetical protein